MGRRHAGILAETIVVLFETIVVRAVIVVPQRRVMPTLYRELDRKSVV